MLTPRGSSTASQTITMPVTINPIPISGPWCQGWALDLHTLSSVFIGDDSFGNPQFDNKRSEIGELLYQFKYRGDRAGFNAICETAAAFILRQNLPVDIVVSVPPSNVTRRHQPLPEIAKGVADRLSCQYRPEALAKVRQTEELKSVYDLGQRQNLLHGAFSTLPELLEGRKILLLDDLFRSGATIAEAAHEILKNGRAKSLVAITLTKTRSNR